MRSIKITEDITCPEGCESFEAERWSFVNVTQNPELKEAVLGGELNLFCCPQCHNFFHGDRDLIYVDEEVSLLIFVFAESNRRQKQKLLQKMKQDYLLLKDTLLKQIHLNTEPVCVFGLNELKEFVQTEENRMDESQVIAAAAATLGLQIVRLEPQWARKNNFPLYTAAGTDETAKSFADSARKVLESGLKSPLLKHFAQYMKGEGADAPKVCYDTEKT